MAQATARSQSSSFSLPKFGKPVAEKTADVIRGMFPDVSEGARATHKYFATFLTVVSALGFMVLLFINTLLAQDAFVLSNLKLEAKQVADQRDAINRQIDRHAAPEALAAAATALGMRPSETPVFLDLTPSQTGVTNG